MEKQCRKTDETMIRIGSQELSFPVRESVSALRINLGFLGKDVRTIMITSSFAGEGKSFVSYNLWMSLAESGKKTVLVDCDLRNSAFFRDHPVSFEGAKIHSLAHVLSEQVELADAVYGTNVENAYLVPSVSSVLNPGFLLSNGKLKETIGMLRETFDYVIVDTPPIRAVADPLQIAQYCDGSILVVQANRTRRSLAEQCYHALERTGRPVLGTVLNQMRVSDPKRYYSYSYE